MRKIHSPEPKPAKPKREDTLSASAFRECLMQFVCTEPGKLPETLEKLEPKDRVQALLKPLPFVAPSDSGR